MTRIVALAVARATRQSEGTGVVSILTDDGKRVTGTVADTINHTSRATINGHWACIWQD